MEDLLAGHIQMVCLMLSWNCPVACRHCAYDCGPNKSPVISSAQGKQLIDYAKQLPLTEAIAFTGGEPFLHYKLLLELSRYVKETCSYPFAISTNAYWATTKERAKEMLAPLAESGLWALMISLDDFHLEFVDQRNVENCTNAAVELGLECHLQSIITRSSRKAAELKDVLGIPHDSPLISWHENPCSPAGRAGDPAFANELVLGWRNRPDSCSMLKTWVVNPLGEISPCCGVAFERNMDIGNAFEEPLPDIVSRANANPVLNALAAYGGPYLLLEFLAKKGCSEYAERSYASNCHACQTVLCDRQAMGSIESELHEHRLELIAYRTLVREQEYRNRREDPHASIWLPEPWFKSSPAEDL